MEIVAMINNLGQVWFANQAWIPLNNLIRKGWNLKKVYIQETGTHPIYSNEVVLEKEEVEEDDMELEKYGN